MELQLNTSSTATPKLPVWVEAAMIGGLGLDVLYGLPVSHAVWNQVTQIQPRVKSTYLCVKRQLGQSLERLKRRRKNGSVVRLVASVLPEYCFAPADRIYVVPLPIASKERGFKRTPFEMTILENHRLIPNEENLIIAFELEDTESNAGEFDVVTNSLLDVESNFNEWDPDNLEYTIPDIVPGESSHAVHFSTPKRGGTERNEPDIVKAADGGALNPNKNLQQLMAMIQNLVQLEVNKTLPHPLLPKSVVKMQNLPVLQQKSESLNDDLTFPSSSPPLSLLRGSQSLTAVKKEQKKRDSTSPDSATVTPVERPLGMGDIVNAKRNLKKLERSKGGSPIKVSARKTSTDLALKNVLTKRYLHMHNSDESEEDEEDQEDEGWE